jgi:hypothetical protein
MDVPHPKEALVRRPSGETVWLQLNDGSLAHQQIPDFENLQDWEINLHTVGTIYRDGKPGIEKVIDGKGIYNLYIAENTETEMENTYYIECNYEIAE